MTDDRWNSSEPIRSPCRDSGGCRAHFFGGETMPSRRGDLDASGVVVVGGGSGSASPVLRPLAAAGRMHTTARRPSIAISSVAHTTTQLHTQQTSPHALTHVHSLSRDDSLIGTSSGSLSPTGHGLLQLPEATSPLIARAGFGRSAGTRASPLEPLSPSMARMRAQLSLPVGSTNNSGSGVDLLRKTSSPLPLVHHAGREVQRSHSISSSAAAVATPTTGSGHHSRVGSGGFLLPPLGGVSTSTLATHSPTGVWRDSSPPHSCETDAEHDVDHSPPHAHNLALLGTGVASSSTGIGVRRRVSVGHSPRDPTSHLDDFAAAAVINPLSTIELGLGMGHTASSASSSPHAHTRAVARHVSGMGSPVATDMLISPLPPRSRPATPDDAESSTPPDLLDLRSPRPMLGSTITAQMLAAAWRSSDSVVAPRAHTPHTPHTPSVGGGMAAPRSPGSTSPAFASPASPISPNYISDAWRSPPHPADRGAAAAAVAAVPPSVAPVRAASHPLTTNSSTSSPTLEPMARRGAALGSRPTSSLDLAAVPSVYRARPALAVRAAPTAHTGSTTANSSPTTTTTPHAHTLAGATLALHARPAADSSHTHTRPVKRSNIIPAAPNIFPNC